MCHTPVGVKYLSKRFFPNQLKHINWNRAKTTLTLLPDPGPTNPRYSWWDGEGLGITKGHSPSTQGLARQPWNRQISSWHIGGDVMWLDRHLLMSRGLTATSRRGPWLDRGPCLDRHLGAHGLTATSGPVAWPPPQDPWLDWHLLSTKWQPCGLTTTSSQAPLWPDGIQRPLARAPPTNRSRGVNVRPDILQWRYAPHSPIR